MNSIRKNDLLLLALGIVVFAVLQGLISARIIGSFWQLNLLIIGINVIMSVSLNLINGYTGQFSLGHAGFMAVGAYVGVVLTTNFHAPFLVALVAGGLAAAFLGFLIGLPTLRLRGDYLAIATLGLGEIIRIVIMNIEYVGGAAGFKGIPHYTTFAWVFFVMLFTLFFIKNFVNSSHGRACIAIRENEIAAEAMGINLAHHKRLSFVISSFFAGVAGAMLAMYNSTLSATTFNSAMTYEILLIVVIGGIGSISGSILASFLFIASSEWWLRFLDYESYIGAFKVPLLRGGFRKVVFSVAIMIIVLFFRRGIMGDKEFSISALTRRFRRKKVAGSEGGAGNG